MTLFLLRKSIALSRECANRATTDMQFGYLLGPINPRSSGASWFKITRFLSIMSLHSIKMPLILQGEVAPMIQGRATLVAQAWGVHKRSV